MRGKWAAGLFCAASGAAMVMAALAGARPPAARTANVLPGRIAFERFHGSGHIYVMDEDGSSVTPLTLGRQPAFSHNGKKIAFVRLHGGGQIYVMNDDGTGLRRLTNDDHGNSEPAFSPAGKNVVFVSNRHGPASGLYEMGAEGGIEKHLVHAGSNAGEPSFSPNGKEILFTRTTRLGEREFPRKVEIFVMAADGTHVVQLTHSGDEEHPRFSPDAKTIVFALRTPNGRFDIHTMHADGSGGRTIVSGPQNDTQPVFSADGKMIVFSRVTSLAARIFAVNADATDVRQLSRPPGGAADTFPTTAGGSVGG
jgi:Tol biopolymer transport system component